MWTHCGTFEFRKTHENFVLNYAYWPAESRSLCHKLARNKQKPIEIWMRKRERKMRFSFENVCKIFVFTKIKEIFSFRYNRITFRGKVSRWQENKDFDCEINEIKCRESCKKRLSLTACPLTMPLHFDIFFYVFKIESWAF